MDLHPDQTAGSRKSDTALDADDNRNLSNPLVLPESLRNWIDMNSNEVVAVWDEYGKLQFVTKSAEVLLGLKLEELEGRHWDQLVRKNDAALIQKGLLELETGGKFTAKLKFEHANGQIKWFVCTISKQERHGRLYFVSILDHLENKKDIDDLYIRSEKLSVAGQLAAGIVHEIRNPLTSLKGFVQLMKAGIEAKNEYYNIMIEEIEKMEAMTTELLYISKPPKDNKIPEYINQMIEDVIVLLEPQAKQKNIKLCWKRGKDAKVYCNRSQIKQVLINLIKNAIEAIEEEGTVEVETTMLANWILIDIVDDGPGVPKNLIKRLGEPFFTTKENGTGLGLMVTKQLLEQHGSTLAIFHNETGGSTFRISMPLTGEESLYN